MKETDLYRPIKGFLESQGYTVKAEVNACDVVALRGDEPPLIVELKTGLTLQLFYQAVDRLALSDSVYVAIPRPKRSVPTEAVKLARRVGLGVIVVSKSGSVEVLCECVPYAPRKNDTRKAALLKEFKRRKGDPNLGGSSRTKLMTAYRQDALRCLTHLHAHGPTRIAHLRDQTQVEKSASILRDNYYGWFEKQARGIYALAEAGRAAVTQFADEIASLLQPAE
jgi:hypothetical protein